MELSKFRDTIFGKAQADHSSSAGFVSYVPKDIPRTIDINPLTQKYLSEADIALGRLDGFAILLPDPNLLVLPFIVKEALSSSRIEGTKASLSDIYLEKRNDDTEEVQRYMEAIDCALELLKSLPITERLIKETHKTLMHNVRGKEKSPGYFRTSPVWIGTAGATLDNSTFVPPLPTLIPQLMNDWEKYVNTYDNTVPTLIRVALAHYQFVTIHPFLDGNGRMGRLLIVIMLIAEEKLSSPLLYVSQYFEKNRDEYYDRLQNIREKGELNEYLQFFFHAVKVQAHDAIKRSQRLIQLREKYSADAQTSQSKVGLIIPHLFASPFITSKIIVEDSKKLGTSISIQTARNLLHQAEKLHWITRVGDTIGKGRKQFYLATEVLDIISDNGEDNPLQ